MGRRTQKRTKTALAVRIFGLDKAGKPFSELGHTLDITSSGARLGGVSRELTRGCHWVE